jgi:hypothetical protein
LIGRQHARVVKRRNAVGDDTTPLHFLHTNAGGVTVL